MTSDKVAMTEKMTWPDLAMGLYEMLTGRGAEITYEFENMEVWVPSRSGEGAEYAKWRFSGTVKIRTKNYKKADEAV